MPIKEFKSKIFPWLNEPKWLNRLTLYFTLGAVIITALHIVFSYSGSLHTDVDSARYMLSALVQSEAAIVALVVTLSLVAVQLAAQSYSARVIEVFRRTPDLWILMGIYGIAIFYGMGVLKMIENPQVGRMSNLEAQIAFSYYLGVFAFVALVPYIWNTLGMLKPSVVINILAKEIDKKNILSAVQRNNEELRDGITGFIFSRGFPRTEKDPILPIIDILRSSLMKFDFETVKEGLEAIRGRVDYILDNETFTSEEERRVAIYIFQHLIGIGKLAASRKDEVSIAEVIDCMQKIGLRGAMREFLVATQFSVIYLREIGKIAVELKFEDATRKIVDSLEFIGRTTASRQFETATIDAIHTLEKIGIAAAEQKLEEATHQTVRALETIGILAIKHLENITKEAASIIGRIGIVAAQQKLEDVTLQATRSLEKVGLAATEQDSEEVSNQVAFSLGAIGIASIELVPSATFQVVESLKVVGLAAAKHNFKNSLKQAVFSMQLVQKTPTEHKLVYHEAEKALKELNDALNKLAKINT
jgi:hypothetical protein